MRLNINRMMEPPANSPSLFLTLLTGVAILFKGLCQPFNSCAVGGCYYEFCKGFGGFVFEVVRGDDMPFLVHIIFLLTWVPAFGTLWAIMASPVAIILGVQRCLTGLKALAGAIYTYLAGLLWGPALTPEMRVLRSRMRLYTGARIGPLVSSLQMYSPSLSSSVACDVALSTVPNLPNLMIIILTGLCLSRKGIAHLQAAPRLKRIELDGYSALHGNADFKALSITSLKLHCNVDLGSFNLELIEELDILCFAVRHFARGQSTAEGSRVTVDISSLFLHLQHLYSLRSLSLRWNGLPSDVSLLQRCTGWKALNCQL